MSRQANIDGLPEQIRLELETRIRRDNMKSNALVDWLESEGYTIGYHAVNRYANKIKAKAALIEAQAEAQAASQRVGRVTGVDVQFDLLDAAKAKLTLELEDYKKEGAEPLKPAQLFSAIARITAVDIQAHKFIHDLRSKVTAEIHSMEGEPGIDLQTLKTIRERVYGIFDAVED